jgi:hypothetical protein
MLQDGCRADEARMRRDVDSEAREAAAHAREASSMTFNSSA